MPLQPTFHPIRLAAALCALAFCGCGEETVATKPDRQFSAAQKSSCPASPFKAEYPIAPKVSAAGAEVEYHIEIYSSAGKYTREMDGSYDPNATQLPGRGGPAYSMMWDGKDYRGREAASGYYFFLVDYSFAGTGVVESQSRCVFYINQSDTGKLE